MQLVAFRELAGVEQLSLGTLPAAVSTYNFQALRTCTLLLQEEEEEEDDEQQAGVDGDEDEDMQEAGPGMGYEAADEGGMPMAPASRAATAAAAVDHRDCCSRQEQ